jgi:NADH:ubiquinone oxidoreductase subunit E
MAEAAKAQAQYDELGTYIESMKNKPGPLMPVMQKAQDIFGSLPFDVQEFISVKMDIPMVRRVRRSYILFPVRAGRERQTRYRRM